MSRTALRLAAPLVLALAISACGGSSSDGGSDTTAATTTTKPTYAGLTADQITFQPVQEIVACDGGDYPIDDVTTTSPDSADAVPAVDGELCYVLGPAGGDGSDVRDAKVYADGVGIEVKVRDDAADAMNDLFNACYAATDACPASSTDGHGYLAVVVDGQVVSTPAIVGEDLATTPFVITGDFDKTQATNIAAAING